MTSLPNRIDPYTVLRKLGYETFLEYSMQRPSSTFQDLAAELGGNSISAADVFRLMRDELKTADDLHQLLVSSLVRIIRSLATQGWKNNGRINFEFTNACSGWAALFGPRYRDNCLIAIRHLRSLEKPDRWVPRGIDDPDICAAIGVAQFRFL